jgi:hypothetical protein
MKLVVPPVFWLPAVSWCSACGTLVTEKKNERHVNVPDAADAEFFLHADDRAGWLGEP